ncbi:MAG: alpha/beta hydrolase family protein [Telluria sp.]
MGMRSLAVCAALLVLHGPSFAAPKVPLAAFVHEDTYTHPRLAPDGKHIAVTVNMPSGDRTVPVLTVYSLPELKITGAIRMPAFDVPLDVRWVSNERFVIAAGKELGSRERPVPTGELLAANYDGSKQEYLYGYQNYRLSRRGDRYGDDIGWGFIQAIPEKKNGHLFVSSHLYKGGSSLLYDIDSVSANRKLLATVSMPDMDFIVQNDGTPRFSYGWGDDGYVQVLRHNDASGAWEKLSGNYGHEFHPLIFQPDDKAFFALYSAKGGPVTLVRENLADGSRTTLFDNASGSATGIQYDAHHLPFAAWSAVGIPAVRYFDNDNPDARLHKLLSAQFPGSVVNFLDFTEDGNVLLFSVRSDRDPGEFYLYNRSTGKADLLFAGMEAINPDDMAERRPISFESRDGHQIYGYLTMPVHAAGTKVPLVVMPHGGPHGIYDEWYFDVDAQFLASRGYAVLQVNFRSSGGRGPNFVNAGNRQWGEKVQNDIIDGLKWTIAQGEVDANRICSYGASFGGYSAMMLAAREPSMFKCAVGYAGVYDLNLMFSADAFRDDKSAQSQIARHIGTDKQELARNSPVTLAGQIKAPVLLVHGGKDKRAILQNAEEMREALTKAGNAPEWLLAPNEGHGFYDTANRTAFYEKLEAFLAKNIGK